MKQGIHCFPKSEKLTSKKTIEMLFKKRQACFVFPYRAVWVESLEEQPTPVRVLFSAPKRRFKRAVDRNRIKRIMREAYRLNRSMLTLPDDKKIALAINYVADDIRDYAYIERKMKELFVQLNIETQSLVSTT